MRKTKNGFTLMETLIALVMVSMIVAPIYVAQGYFVNSTSSIFFQTKRIFLALRLLAQSRLEQSKESTTFTKQEQEKNPPMTARYELKSLEPTSSLKKIKNLYKEVVVVKDAQNRQESTIISFRYKGELPKP